MSTKQLTKDNRNKTVRIIDGKRTIVYAATSTPFGDHIIGEGDRVGFVNSDSHNGARIKQSGGQ